jgi:uncharacterized protein
MRALPRLSTANIGALAVALAALRIGGWHIVGPRGGRQAGQWIIGTALGLYFTPPVAARVGGIAWLLLGGGAPCLRSPGAMRVVAGSA